MKYIVVISFLLSSVFSNGQEVERGHIGIGLRFLTTLSLSPFSVKSMDNGNQSGEFKSGDGEPFIGGGIFFDYYIGNHTAGLSYSLTVYNNEFHNLYTDGLIDQNGNFYTKYQSDYVDHYFNNYHSVYKYVVEDDKTRLGLVVGPGYHLVQLNGNSNISVFRESPTWESVYTKYHTGQTQADYWSFKTGVELSYFPTKHFGLYGYIGYDFAFGNAQNYSFDYDQELVDSGELLSITREFIPPTIGEINLGIHFIL